MATEVQNRLADFVRRSQYGFCYTCLAKRFGVTDKDIREAAQVVAMRTGFVLTWRVCYGCRIAETVLAYRMSQSA
jgi:hypothetical protein